MPRTLLAAGLLVVTACGGDGGGGTTGSASTATLIGIVREAGTGTPISGATVTAGRVSVATAADGRFTIPDVPIGTDVTVSVSAAGYDSYTQTITIKSGPNSHEVSLSRITLFELSDKVLYLPPGVSTYRGILFDLPGSTGDSRPWIRGDLTQTHPGYGDLAEFRKRALVFAEQHQFAIMGTNTFPAGSSIDPSTLDPILSTLVNFAAVTGHPELAQVPLLLFGHSLGGCVAYNFMLRHAGRVIGLITQKGPCHSWVVNADAASVPAYLVIGALDPQNSIGNITGLFERGRAQGAPWSVVVLPEEGHERSREFDMLFNWMNTIVALRLPSNSIPAQPVQLRAIDTTAGWLADRSAGVIARFSCYAGDTSVANWFPAEQTARDWRTAAALSESAPVITC
jgi:pimeloyl-ACP methyl ester carboxylesterase